MRGQSEAGGLGHGVVTPAGEGMAAAEAACGEPTTAQPAVADDGDVGVFAAGGEVLALGGGEDVEQGREGSLVQREQGGGEAFAAWRCGSVGHEMSETVEASEGAGGWGGGAVVGSLDAAKDGGDFALELGEVEVDDAAAGVKDDVDRGGEMRECGADGFAQAALDAVAIDRLAEGLGNGEADAGAGGCGAAGCWAGCVEVGELLAELLAAGLVDELVVGVFAESMRVGGDRHGACSGAGRLLERGRGCGELLFDGAGHGGLLIAGMLGGDGFDQGEPGFFGGGGVVANAAGDDEELTGVEEDVASVGWGAADAQLAAEDQEHLVLMGVGVPGKLSLDADYLDVLIVDLTDDSRRPELYAGAAELAAREFQ